MSRKYVGGCQCGAVRYEVSGKPMMAYACHCTICQKQSGSAFGMAVIFEGHIQQTGTAPEHFVREGHGRDMRCYFCPRCGSRTHHQWFTAEGDLPFLNLKPGTLDEPGWVNPGCHIWTQHKLPAIELGSETVQFEQQPPPEQMPRFQGE